MNIIKRIGIISIMTLLTMSAFAQGVIVHLNNGQTTVFKASDVEKIVFADELDTPDDDAVDLGLSVMWASTNLGASTPQEYGSLYAWGELSPKEVYSWSTYAHCNGDIYSLTKYNNDQEYGIVDDISHLQSCDDAATHLLGDEWHIPSRAEWEELHNRCTWTWNKEMEGYDITGPNGNSIFLPANGYYNADMGGYKFNGEYGFYQSSDLNTSFWYYQDCTAFYGPDEEYELDADHYPFYSARCNGIGIRPVKIKPAE